MRLLVIDGDPEIRLSLHAFFEQSGVAAEFESDGPHGAARASAERYDLALLDLALPDAGGFEILRRIRNQSRLPVMVLSATSGHTERVQAFDLGADDFLAKPFYPEELLARVRAILRRAAPSPAVPKAVHAGHLTVVPSTRRAFYRGRQLPLTAMECDILEQLLRSSGRPVSRDELSLHLYNRVCSPFDRSIDTHVGRIRRKMGDGRDVILSVRGTGYQLCLETQVAQ